jgi:hypothetical protein
MPSAPSPHRRALPGMLLAAVALLVAGCDYFRPIEQVCEKRLAPAEIRVTAAPIEYRTDLTKSTEQLTSMGAASAGGRILGLTQTNMKSSVSFGSNGITHRISGKHCMRPIINVKLAFEPMTVLVSRAYSEGSCEFKLTMDHEMRHVGAYAAFLADAAPEVERELRERFGKQISYFASEAEAERHVQSVTRQFLGPFVDENMKRVVGVQALIDAPEEYARLDQFHRACSSGRDQ